MTSLKHRAYPRRIPAAKLAGIYGSVAEAFAANDHLYVARYGENEPELRGCALILLGNRAGGERILDRHGICSAQTCLYRAYAAWQDGDENEARDWLARGKALDNGDARFDRLAALVNQHQFRIVVYSDFSKLNAYKMLPGFDVVEVRSIMDERTASWQSFDPAYGRIIDAEARFLPIGRSITSAVSAKPPVDLVLLDDMKLVPVGIADFGAPVAVNFHDHECYYEFLGDLAPEVDLFSAGASSDLAEVAHAFGRKGTVQAHMVSVRMPKFGALSASFSDPAARNIDLLFTGGITDDFYRDKRQTILPLAELDETFLIKIVEGFFPLDEYDNLLKQTRFTISSVRAANYLSSRTFDALACGVFSLVEEENGLPYIFSEYFHCFPSFSRQNMLVDINRHLRSYDESFARFQPQIPRLDAELKSMFPDDERKRATRYLRHLLFMTKVQGRTVNELTHPEQAGPRRTFVHYNEYSLLAQHQDQLEEAIEQTPSQHRLRLALAKTVLAAGNREVLLEAVAEGLAEFPDSLALHYACGLGKRMCNLTDEAGKEFSLAASGNLRLMPMDPFPSIIDPLNGFYWITDARIRARCAKMAEPLVPEKSVWQSYALSHLADMALECALASLNENRREEAIGQLEKTGDLAGQALDLFPCGEAAQRIYLRAHYGLASSGVGESADVFLESFDAACQNDYMMLNDFAPMAIHLLMQQKRTAEAQAVLRKLIRFLSRVTIGPGKFMLYPEATPILRKYGIPHGGSPKPEGDRNPNAQKSYA